MHLKARLPLLFVVLFAICPGCKSIEDAIVKARPKASLTGVHFGELKRDALNLIFDVEIKNPYPVGLPLTNLSYSLTSGENEFIAGAAKADKVIPAGSKEEVSLPVSVDYGRILRYLKGIRPGSTIPYKAQLALSVDTQTLGPIDLPLKKQGEITLPTVSSALKSLWDLVTD